MFDVKDTLLLNTKKHIVRRPVDDFDPRRFAGLHPVLRRIYLARHIASAEELDRSLEGLPPPWSLSGMDNMAGLLAEAVMAGKRLLVVADFDADGATACSVAVRGLRWLGAGYVDYLEIGRAHV